MSSNSPCAACKFQRRKCTPECIFAPYFPPEDPQKFVNVHKVFGGSNVSKILSDLNPAQRDEAARSLAFEAECRLQDPIYGCVGYIAQLQQRLKQLHFDLSTAKEELATYIGPSALLPTFPQHNSGYNNNNGQIQMMYNNNVVVPQQQMMGNPPSALPYTNLIGAPTTVVYGAGTSQQQPQMMISGGVNINPASSNTASALPYTSLMPSGGLASQEELQQHGVVNPMIQQYARAVDVAATSADHGQHDQLLRNYEQQQQQQQQQQQHQDYLVFKNSCGEDQYELQAAAADGSYIQMAAAAADQDEIGAAGPSLALGVNYDQNPYNNNNNNQIYDQQEHDEAEQQHIAFQAQLGLLPQHPENHVLQTHQRKAESDEGISADPAASC